MEWESGPNLAVTLEIQARETTEKETNVLLAVLASGTNSELN